MSTLEEYEAPFTKMVDEMGKQMAEPENVAKPIWTGDKKSYGQLLADLKHNVAMLGSAIESENITEAWRRAANVGNYAWMLADRIERKET